MRLDPGSLYDYEARAQQVLPHDYWDFIAGGSKDELTTQRNRSAFDAMSLRPRFLRDVTERTLATTVLGTPISFPVMVSPTGGHKLAHPEGECATARGAGMSQTLMMLSTSSHCSLEDVAKAATGPLWFQLYHRGHDVTKMLVQRAEHAGYKAIVLTVDTPLPAPKERDIRNRYANPFPLANFGAMPEDLPAMSGTDEAPNWQPARVPALTWKELDWLRSLTTLPLVLKGIRTAEDARLAVDGGVNGVLVSTHGGRQMDATLSAIESLPEVVEVCAGRAEVYLDSGVRRGSDVLKALALGARAVGVGRPLYWGLAVNGAEGVHGMLELLRQELDQALGYCGQTDVKTWSPAWSRSRTAGATAPCIRRRTGHTAVLGGCAAWRGTIPGAHRVNTYLDGECATSIVLRRGPPRTTGGAGPCRTARQRARCTGRAARRAVRRLHDGIMHEVLGMAFVITGPCMDVMDQACIRVYPVACIQGDTGKDRKLYIDPDACIDCGACAPVCPVNAIYADVDLPTPWRAYADIDALWYRDKEAVRARVAVMQDGR